MKETPLFFSLMRPRCSITQFVITIYVSLLLILLAIQFAPFASNRDDFIRYYFGGYVGSVQIRGAERSQVLQKKTEDAMSRLPSTHDKLRFGAGRTPYIPFFIATTPIGMAIFEQTSGIHPATWILGFHTLLWVIGILAGALFIFHNPRICSTAWFLAAGVAIAWLNVHTSPFLPIPRGASTLAAGLALACYLSESKTRYIIMFLVLGAFFHSYQHLMNIGAIFLFLVLIWSDRPLEFLRSGSTWKMGASAVLTALAGIAIVWYANSMSFLRFDSLLDATAEYDVWANWEVNREAFEMSVRNLGPLLLILLFLEKGWKTTLGCAVVFLGGFLVAALVGPSGAYYQGEYVLRLAAMWSVIVFALLLKRDLFRALKDSIVRNSRWVTTGIALLCLVFLWKSFDAWNPETAWKRFVVPSAIEWGPVETECLRILVNPA